MPAGRRLPLLCLLPCLLLCACRHNNNQILENELRAKDALYRDALSDLKRIEAHNEALMREIAATRHGTAPLPPEIAAPTFGLQRITLGRGTGGYDNDSLPGDEALLVIVEPRDGEEHVVKVPGSLHVSALEVNAQGLKQPLCWWSLTPEQLRPQWKQNLFSTGYSVVLPWTVLPHSCTVRIVVQFKIADGRVFEADRDVKVRPLTSVPAAPVVPTLPMPKPAQPKSAQPGPTPTFILPSGGIGETPALQWTPAPLTDAVDLGRPLPIPE